MIFQHTWQRVLDGSKTQTRRLFGESARPKVKLGHSYAVQPGRGKKSVGRIRITGIRLEPLQMMYPLDAQAEGVASIAEFKALWDSINGHKPGQRWIDNPLVYVITFEVVRP